MHSSDQPGSTKFRIANQVVLVHGKYASALYDLYRHKIQRISRGLGNIIESGSWESLSISDRATFDAMSRRLYERGFLAVDRGNMSKPLVCNWSVTRYPVLRTVSFSVDDSNALHAEFRKSVVLKASREFGLCSFAYLTTLKNVELIAAEADSTLRETQDQICEFWIQGAGETRAIEKL